MGKHFGNIQKLKGITYYTLSPYELNPFKGMLNPGFANTVRRCRESFFWVTAPILIIYMITSTAKEIHRKANRKNPDDYKNDV